MREVLDEARCQIAHVIIPTRRLDIAVASRIRAADYGRLPFRTRRAHGDDARHGTGGSARRDARRDRRSVGRSSTFPTPCSSSRGSPRDAGVRARAAVVPWSPDATVDDVRAALDRCVRPELIHEAPLSRQERWRMRSPAAWMRSSAIPSRHSAKDQPGGRGGAPSCLVRSLHVSVRARPKQPSGAGHAGRRSGSAR